ncbi:MAG TPA: histidine kinase [Spirochaetia bacterium]|nr:histidine kinase [Spirochaetia bacterium]
MRIRAKLFSITGLIFLNVIIILVLSVWTMREISRSEHTVDQGLSLLAESRLIHGYMKDLVFDLFTPQMYTLVKDLVYTPGYSSTIDYLDQSVTEFTLSFDHFMASPRVVGLLHDTQLRDEYNTAITMSHKAFGKIGALQKSLVALQEAGVLGQVDLYLKIQNDASLLSFFDNVRTTSYYLDNSFQSFLEHFVASLQQEANHTQRRILWVFWLYSAFSGLLTVFISFLFSDRIAKRIGMVEEGVRAMSQGNFSLHLDIKTRDEFGILSSRISGFVQDLKHNVDAVLRLMRDVSSAINDRSDLDGLLVVVVQAICQDLEADCALVASAGDDGIFLIRAQAGKIPTNMDEAALRCAYDRVIAGGNTVFDGRNGAEPVVVGSLIALPLEVQKQQFGVLMVMTGEGSPQLNDLDVTSVTTFALYTSVTIENYRTYNELLERREAEFQALQSQIQPHFLYNVLSGFVGLNRLGDRSGLERAILALKEMMRYILEHDEHSTVKEEFLFLEKYCALQKIRFQERLEVRLECDTEAGDIRIPKLLLQPLVENAIIHGIEPLDRGGRLSVVAAMRNGAGGRHLEVTIDDDGIGFVPGRIEQDSHIGLWNVLQRLNLSNPASALQIRSEPGSGTSIEIRIPAVEYVA